MDEKMLNIDEMEICNNHMTISFHYSVLLFSYYCFLVHKMKSVEIFGSYMNISKI